MKIISQDPGSDFKCEDEGFYAHPRDCKKYFWCLEAAGLGIVAHQFTCPSGLYFNKAADSCDYSRNVHCDKKAQSTTTTTTTEEPRTTTRAAISTTARTNPLYKSPSRATTARTTTKAYEEPSTEAVDLDQEDPTVIKELIDLIKKVGGIEELERQLSLQEDGAAVTIGAKVTDQKSTTPPAISKTLYEKIKNRASVFQKRPTFNGASQPERVLETSKETEKEKSTTTTPAPTKTTQSSFNSKKYNSVNRNSRPGPQNAGIKDLPESDAILIEKPQYMTIRRKPVKPAVVAENDYNSENSSDEDSRSSSVEREVTKKYATINRSRRPQVQVVDDDDDDEQDEDEEILVRTSTTAKPTSRYVNISRRRITTEEPEER